MSPSLHRLTIAAYILTAGVAFIIGRWSVSVPDDLRVRGGVSPKGRSGNLATEATIAEHAANKAADASVAAANPSRERLAPALKERNRLTRLKHVLDWTESINEGNWREAFDVWLRSGASSAYARDIEARVVMEKIGAMGGVAALEAIADSSRDLGTITWRSRQGVAGWASRNPQEAMDWVLKLQAIPGQSAYLGGEVRGGLMEGLTQSDMNLSRQLSGQVREGWRDEHFRGIIENMERNGEGAEGVKAWIEQSRQDGKDPGFTTQLISTYVERELELLQAGGGDAGIYDWVASQSGRPGSPPELPAAVAASMARSHPEQAMDWLSHLPAESLPPETISNSVSRVLTEWQSLRPEGVAAWLAANPNHPLRAAVRSAAAQLPPAP